MDLGINVGRNQTRINGGMDKLRGFLGGMAAQPADAVVPAPAAAMPMAVEMPVAAAASEVAAGPKMLLGDRMLARLKGAHMPPAAAEMAPQAANIVEGGAGPKMLLGDRFLASIKGRSAPAARRAAPSLDIAGTLGRMGGSLRAMGDAGRAGQAAPDTLKGVLELARSLRINRIP